MRSLLFVAISALLQSASTLSGQFAQIAATSGGRVGVSVQLIESGERDGLNQTERFPMQSVTEKDMAPAAFHSPMRDAHPHGGIDVSVQDLMRAAIVESDGVASDVRLRLAGGAPPVTAYLRGLGIRDMTVATSELATSRDPKARYRNDSTPGPKRLKELLPATTAVADKTGTDATRNGLTAATNDIGIITLPDGRHLAIAVLVKDSAADEATREATIARIARAAFDRWSAR